MRVPSRIGCGSLFCMECGIGSSFTSLCHWLLSTLYGPFSALETSVSSMSRVIALSLLLMSILTQKPSRWTLPRRQVLIAEELRESWLLLIRLLSSPHDDSPAKAQIPSTRLDKSGSIFNSSSTRVQLDPNSECSIGEG